MISTELLSDAEIERVKQYSFSNHNHGDRRYPIQRSPEDYERTLPKFNNQTFVEAIEDKLIKDRRANLLDVGCGVGVMLAEMGNNYPNLGVYGLSAYDLRDRLPEPWQSMLRRVDYRVGDAHDIASIFPDVKFDFVVSLYAHEYMFDPISVLEQEYQLCNEGGIIFLDKFYPKLTIDEKPTLEAHMAKQGINFDLRRFAPLDPKWDPVLHHLIIQKRTTPTITLPFKPVGIEYHKVPDGATDTVSEARLEYNLSI